ncbi:amino acid adenylation domain-containing protein (plasmid) [Streptomyces viridifaciens]|nr:amino acid adenylation domain-containing protein [Streptomyces viridifaciens]
MIGEPDLGLLQNQFLLSAQRFPLHAAISLNGVTHTYQEIDHLAATWAGALREAVGGRPQRVGVLANKDLTAYAGILAALGSGATVVPLNPGFPATRSRAMLRAARPDVIITGDRSADRIRELVSGLDDPPQLVMPFARSPFPADHAARAPVLDAAAVSAHASTKLPEPADDGRPAYLLFTSGTTGEPKGIPISHANVTHFLQVAAERYGFTADDRFSQTFDQTFDLSFFDMFMSWRSGGCLFPMGPGQLLEPVRFIQRNDLTVWFSVPSVVALMRRRGLLRPGRLPSLRWSLFCGEALPDSFARMWHEAAPHSVVENLYGPTEVTIACLRHRWRPERSPGLVRNGSVPIGKANRGLRCAVVDDALRPVSAGTDGELCVAGPQVFAGYWDQPEATRSALVRIADGADALESVWYRTGDIVRELDGGEYTFVGRRDGQVKVGGYRVEISEIEATLNAQPGVSQSVVVLAATPEGEASQLVAFVVPESPGTGLSNDLAAAVRAVLPHYMVPSRWVSVDQLPLNVNGKVDRTALRELAERDGRQ